MKIKEFWMKEWRKIQSKYEQIQKKSTETVSRSYMSPTGKDLTALIQSLAQNRGRSGRPGRNDEI